MRIQALLTAAVINLKRLAAALLALWGLVLRFLRGSFLREPRSSVVTPVDV